MRVLACDPGPTKSGWCLIEDGVPTRWGWDENDALRQMLSDYAADEEYVGMSAVNVAIEYLRPRGMPTAGEEMDTLFELGRLTADVPRARLAKVSRHEVKLALCGNARAKDKNIRQALIDRYGGDRVAFGVKCSDCHGKGWIGRGRPPCVNCDATGWEVPVGPLVGIASHVWSALAVGVTYMDTNGNDQ